MQLLDIFLIIPLAWGAYKGFSKGLIVEVAAIVALIFGIYGALHFSEYAHDIISNHLTIDSNYHTIGAFALTFIAIVVAVHLVAKMVEKFANLIALKLLNKLAGALFGFLKMGMIVSILLFIFGKVDQHSILMTADTKAASLLYQPIKSIAEITYPMIQNEDLFKAIGSGKIDASFPN